MVARVAAWWTRAGWRIRRARREHAAVFVAQDGDVAVGAVLLAASLRAQLGRHVALVAMVPEMFGTVRAPDAAAAAALAALDVRGVTVRNAHCVPGAVEGVGDGHSNKAWAVSVPTERPRLLLLDSDVLCLQPPALLDAPDPAPFRAKPVDVPSPVPWPALYALFDLPAPAATMAPTVEGPPGPPYFNSGVVALEAAVAPALGACWRDTFARVTASGLMDGLPFFREQASLALAVARLALRWDTLGEDANWPAHMRAVEAARCPALAHYHRPAVIAASPVLREAVQRVAARWPAVRTVLAAQPSWAPLLH